MIELVGQAFEAAKSCTQQYKGRAIVLRAMKDGMLLCEGDNGERFEETYSNIMRSTKAAKKEQKEARDFLDRNIIDLEVVLANIELIELFRWADDELCNGAALHIIVEDGNYSDSDVDYCDNQIKSGEWAKTCEKHHFSYTEEDNVKMLRILELMKPITEEQREMLCNRTTITGDLFDLLYNQALTE